MLPAAESGRVRYFIHLPCQSDVVGDELHFDNQHLVSCHADLRLSDWLQLVWYDLFKGPKRACIGRFVLLPQYAPLPGRLVSRAFTNRVLPAVEPGRFRRVIYVSG